jgi:RHS repeat-associated protein
LTTTHVVALLGLPQVLVETTGGSSTAYLHGHDLLGEEGTAWAWHLNDGLGSVRQLTDGDGDVTLAQGYTPFGVLLWREGSGASGYGYTGEQEDGAVGLLYLRARWYAPGVGRFTTRDTWPGDSFRSMSHNDWLYVYANPINLTDPSGHDPNCRKGAKRCARERILEIIEEEDPNRAEALFRLFEDDELFDLWGKAAGRTSDKRLTWVLKSAESVPFLPIDFGIEEFAGDCGFAEEFRDSQLYPIWELDPSESNQVGHFLSAVDITYGAWPTGLMIGHEQVSDRKRLRNWLSFLIYVKEEDYDHWDAAVEYDEGGFSTQRDEELWAILRFKPTTPFGGVEAERRGNSLQDLRLSLKGYRFALWVRENKSLHPIRAGRWLRNNLGIKTLINAPR